MLTLEQARKARTKHRFMAGKGYFRVPEPRMPAEIIAGPETCLPPENTATGTWHFLKARQDAEGNKLVRMQWDTTTQEWSPELGSGGRRLGYKVAYLAAHGWTYVGADE